MITDHLYDYVKINQTWYNYIHMVQKKPISDLNPGPSCFPPRRVSPPAGQWWSPPPPPASSPNGHCAAQWCSASLASPHSCGSSGVWQSLSGLSLSIYTCTPHTHIHTNVHTHTHTLHTTHTQMHTHMHADTQMHARACTCTHRHADTHTHSVLAISPGLELSHNDSTAPANKTQFTTYNEVY